MAACCKTKRRLGRGNDSWPFVSVESTRASHPVNRYNRARRFLPHNACSFVWFKKTRDAEGTKPGVQAKADSKGGRSFAWQRRLAEVVERICATDNRDQQGSAYFQACAKQSRLSHRRRFAWTAEWCVGTGAALGPVLCSPWRCPPSVALSASRAVATRQSHEALRIVRSVVCIVCRFSKAKEAVASIQRLRIPDSPISVPTT